MAEVDAKAVPSDPSPSQDGNKEEDLLNLQPVKVQKPNNNRSGNEKGAPPKPQHPTSFWDAVPFTPSQGVRTPSPGIAQGMPWTYSPFSAHAYHPPESPKTVLRPNPNGSDASSSSDSSAATQGHPLPPMGMAPLHAMGSMGYPPFMAVYHPHALASMGSWNHGAALPPGGEPGSPRAGGPPSPLMGSPVGTPTAMMFPQTPFAGAHHQPFSPYHHLPSPGHGPFGPDHHPLSPQGSGAGYGYFHPIFNTMPVFAPPPPPRTHSIGGRNTQHGSGSNGSGGAPQHDTGAAPSSQGKQGAEDTGSSPPPASGSAQQGSGAKGETTPQNANSPDTSSPAPNSASRVMAGSGSPGPHGFSAAQAALHAVYGVPPGLQGGAMPPFYGFHDPALLTHMAAAAASSMGLPAPGQSGGSGPNRNSNGGRGAGGGAGSMGTSPQQQGGGYANKRPPPLHVSAGNGPAQMMVMPPPWSGAGGPMMGCPPPGMMLHMHGGNPAEYWDVLQHMALSMSMGLMPMTGGHHLGDAHMGAPAPFEFPDLSAHHARGGHTGLGMSPPHGLPFMPLAHAAALMHGTPPSAGMPHAPPPRGQLGGGNLSASATPSPPNPKARRALQQPPYGATPGSGGSGSGLGPGAGTPPQSGTGAAGADLRSVGMDGLPRLNARQRRTLRRAKERAIKGLMEAGHLLLARTAGGGGGASGPGDDSSGSDAEDAAINNNNTATPTSNTTSAKSGGASVTPGGTNGGGGAGGAASMEAYLRAAMSVAAGSHGPQAAADASAALSKVAAELEDMDIGEHGDIGDLITQLAARKQEGLVDDGLIRDLTIIQNLMGALKLPMGGSRTAGTAAGVAGAGAQPGHRGPGAGGRSGLATPPAVASPDHVHVHAPGSGASTPPLVVKGVVGVGPAVGLAPAALGDRTDATAVLHVAGGSPMGVVH